MEQRLAAHPDDAGAWFELGCVLNRCGRPADALRALDSCLTLSPSQPAALCERGLALLSLRSLEAAADSFEELLADEPLNGTALFSLGSVRYRQHRYDEASALWRHAAGVLEDPVEALENLAIALQHLQRPAEERAVWHQVLAHQPGHPAALHKLASLGACPAPPRASAGYLTRLFDAFAPEFDHVLARLNYAGPALIAAVAREVVGPPAGALRVLDAGCGTGLCGLELSPWARELVGIDISAGMLERARARGIYHQLHQTELLACRRLGAEGFDLVTAADVLNYSGELEELLAVLAGLLKAGGRLIFTLEKAAESAGIQTYQLGTHGRYLHQPAYAAACLQRAGVQVLCVREATLRQELGLPVTSLVVAAGRQ